MKKQIISLTAAVVVLSMTFVAYAGNSHHHHGDDKVAICHQKGSGDYVKILVDEDGLNGHGDHEGDIILEEKTDSCPEPSPSPSPSPTPTETPSPTPTESPSPTPSETPIIDICLNIEGVQEIPPEGYVFEAESETCVLIEQPSPTPSPSPSETPEPTPSETPEPTPEPSPSPEDSPAPSGGSSSVSVHGGNGPIGPIVIYMPPASQPPATTTPEVPAGNVCQVPGGVMGFNLDTGVVGDGAITLYWDLVHAAESIQVFYGPDKDNLAFTTSAENNGSLKIGGLTNGTHYWFQIRGDNSCGTGAKSELIDPLP